MFPAVHRLVAALACAALLVLCSAFPRLHAETEARALWVVRTTLTSPAAIATMVSAAKAGGFNTLLVQIRGRGDAYYQGALEPRPPALAGQPAFDPLATTIARAHEAGLKVHAWVNVNLVAGAGELPSGRDHIVYRHPEWLMVPRALADDLNRLDPRSPEYIGRLSRYVRSVPNGLEGLYLSPISDGAVAYTADVVRDIAERYDVDGVHLDYVRYPGDDFDYSRNALTAFRDSVIGDLPITERRRLDARLADEPAIYTRAFPERWHAFRTARLTTMVEALSRTIRATRHDAVVSAAVVPDRVEAAKHRLQDWAAWLDRDLIDVLCPMAYTADMQLFAQQVAAARTVADRHPLWAGIGAYRLSTTQVADHVQAARRAGAAGIILFSYDSLADPARGPDYLAQVGRAAFSDQ